MSGAEPIAFLHLTSCPSAADVITETVRRLGRDEIVMRGHDALNEGPLHDVDAGASSRLEWWTRVYGRALDPELARELDDADLWGRVRSESAAVMLWHGPHPMERLFALRACWHLRDQPGRVYEVAIRPGGGRWPSGPLPAFYDAVSIIGPGAAENAWQRRAKVTDVAARAKKWEELRAMPGEGIRALENEEIVHLPITTYDAELVRACANDWAPSLLVVASVLAANATGDPLLCWRMRELLRTGALEGRGEENRLRLPEEVRPRSRS